ncbi:MAG: ATP-binding protein [Parvibaculum sp.]|uniref:sensor histidine kinase n=1 Tax=Parvibaculum sp. TaxID=2024848 RepID=UPI002730D67D|nr:ATP-binding protein [Parvibaculum sp.]MDP2151205.1 ATP-binding protein [Parvibaculum sp.]
MAVIAAGRVAGIPLALETAPAFVVLGIADIATGIAWMRGEAPSAWARATGVAFVIWGIHKFDYPFIRPVEWLAPVGYLFGAVLSLLIAILVLISYFEIVKRRLTASEERYRALFTDSTSVMLLIDSESGVIVDANAAATAYYGWSHDEMCGMRVDEINTLTAEEIRSEMKRAAEQEKNHFRFRHRHADGSVTDVEVYSGPVQVGDRSLLYSIVHDITRRVTAERELENTRAGLETLVLERTSELVHANEELERATRQKDEFLASMSHELRTPLNSVIGFSGTLLRGLAGDLNDEQKRQVEMISRSGSHLLELVNDILDLERIDAGMAEVFERMSAEKGLWFRATVEPGVSLVTDRRHLEQILWNILGNAVKFTRDGGVSLTVNGVDSFVVFEVSDTGVGIDPMRIESIFDEFVQVSQHAGSSQGTGLGLAISRRLADLLGGRITVSSVGGEGSVFKLEVPTTPPPVDVGGPVASRKNVVERHLRCLIIDVVELGCLHRPSSDRFFQ